MAWSDPELSAMVARFVPCADEVWRLQQGTDPECVFFQKMAEHGHYGGRPGQTRQGIYVCSADGTFLASVNSNNPDRVLATLERGLKAWEELPAERRRLSPRSAIEPRHRWEDSFPKGGLVLSMITRDLPPDCDPGKPGAALSHATLYPQQAFGTELWAGEGSVAWTPLTQEQHPMQAQIIAGAAALPNLGYRDCTYSRSCVVLHEETARALT